MLKERDHVEKKVANFILNNQTELLKNENHAVLLSQTIS